MKKINYSFNVEKFVKKNEPLFVQTLNEYFYGENK